jgi:hypothetical protein
VTLTFGPRTRALLIVLVLALAAVGAGLLVLGRGQSSTDAAPPPTTAVSPTTKATPARPSPAPRPAPAQAAPGDQLPAAIQSALGANHIVVVELYDPNAKVDDTALAEAQAGAQLGGASFAAVDVTKSDVDSLNARYGVIQDPAVLVLRPPGDLVVRIDGFADRDTVAQAAANAAS